MSTYPRSEHPYITRVSGRARPVLRRLLETSRSYNPEVASREPLFADAYTKCEERGATCRTRLDYMLHVSVTGSCIARTSGQKPRIDRVQQNAPGYDER